MQYCAITEVSLGQNIVITHNPRHDPNFFCHARPPQQW
jgi:hypothetical protein